MRLPSGRSSKGCIVTKIPVETPEYFLYTSCAFGNESLSAQVAQAVERSPEKAGVGGSTPSLGTMCCLCVLELKN